MTRHTDTGRARFTDRREDSLSAFCHDFSNLLVAIVGNASLLTQVADLNARDREAAELIETSANRAVEMLRDLTAAQRQRVRVADVVDVVVRLFGSVLSDRGINLTLELPDPAPELAPAVAQALQVALFCVLIRGVQGMPDGGLLRVGWQPDTAGRPALRVEHTRRRPSTAASKDLLLELAATVLLRARAGRVRPAPPVDERTDGVEILLTPEPGADAETTE